MGRYVPGRKAVGGERFGAGEYTGDRGSGYEPRRQDRPGTDREQQQHGRQPDANLAEQGLDNTLQTKSFTLQVGAGGGCCAAPASAGIDICSLVSGATVSSPVAVSATGTVTGTFLRFEVWVDGVKKFTSTTTDGANLSLALAAGKHTFSFYAVNTAGTKWNQVSVITVK